MARVSVWVRVAGLVAGAGLLAAGAARAEDWPHWRGPRRDGISREAGLVKSWPASGPKIAWEKDLTGGWSTPSVVGGKLYVTTEDNKEEIVLCLDAATGKPVWEYRYPCDYDQHPSLDQRFKSGPRSSPTVDDGHIYTLGTTGLLHCLDAASGKPVWKTDLLAMAKTEAPIAGYCSSPMIEGDTLYVNPGGAGTSVAALNKKDGRVLWQTGDDAMGYATPVLLESQGVRQVLYFTGGGLVSVSPTDGKPLWRFDWKTPFDLNVATPIHHNGEVFISTNYGRGCALLRLKGAAQPEEVYRSANMQNHFATSVLWDGHLYGLSNDRLRCVEWATGEVKWDQRGIGRGSVMIADGQLIILGERGELILAELSPIAFTEKARWRALNAPCWSPPSLANGLLYIRNEDKLIAVDMRAGQ
ncbi:MAG: PQQ-binding-like beta-propeller repeat protein [Armatimonadota bacterium]